MRMELVPQRTISRNDLPADNFQLHPDGFMLRIVGPARGRGDRKHFSIAGERLTYLSGPQHVETVDSRRGYTKEIRIYNLRAAVAKS